MKKQSEIILLIILILTLFLVNYSFLDSKLEEFLNQYESANITRIIDGDTVKNSEDESIRLLGINSPEKGKPYYDKSKNFLKNKIFNKTVKLKFVNEKRDRYDRILAYIILNGKNINLELVRRGFANFYFPSGKDVYYDEFKKAWEKCIKDNKNLCKKSKDVCSSCIKLEKFDYKNQKIIFDNSCNFSCDLTDWSIKDEGRKEFVFDDFILDKDDKVEIIVGDGLNTEDKLFWKNENYVWTKTGDTLFLRDDDYDLVLWESY